MTANSKYAIVLKVKHYEFPYDIDKAFEVDPDLYISIKHLLEYTREVTK